RRRHTRSYGDWSSDVCSSDLLQLARSCPESHAGGPGHHDLQAPGVGHHGLAAVDRPRVGWRLAPRQRPGPDHLLELEAWLTRPRSEERRVGKEGKAGWSG